MLWGKWELARPAQSGAELMWTQSRGQLLKQKKQEKLLVVLYVSKVCVLHSSRCVGYLADRGAHTFALLWQPFHFMVTGRWGTEFAVLPDAKTQEPIPSPDGRHAIPTKVSHWQWGCYRNVRTIQCVICCEVLHSCLLFPSLYGHNPHSSVLASLVSSP